MSISELKSMPVEDRIQLMEQIWESLCLEEQAIESPAWHEGILRERKKKIDSGEGRFLTLDELKERFRP
jgi:putative addiction module component (TIGR02574 family)